MGYIFDISPYPYRKFERKNPKMFKQESIEVLKKTFKHKVIITHTHKNPQCICLCSLQLDLKHRRPHIVTKQNQLLL